LANNIFQVKRTSTSGRTPNTTSSSNSQYINAGEFALNMTDQILYTSDGTNLITVGANTVNHNVTGNLTVKAIVANNSLGTANQVLTSNGSTVYWSTVSGGGGGSALPARQIYTANGSVNTFTVTGGYYANNLDVYLNGVKLVNGTDVNTASGSTFTILGSNPPNNAVIEVVGTSALTTTGVSTVVNQQITANGSANSFAITGGYIPNGIQVYLNGVKQIPGTNVFITSGANVGFAVTPSNNYIIDVYGYQTAVSYVSNTVVVGNTTIGLNSITTNAISANGSVGSNGQVLTSNGSAVYWGAGNGPAFSCYPNAQQTISNSTFTLVANQVKEYDTNTCYNNTGSTVTLNGLSVPAYAFCPNVAGYYMFTGAIQYGASITDILVQLSKNGGAYQKRGSLITGTSAGTSVAAMFYLNGTGDYVQLYTYQGSGSSQNTDGISGDWPIVQYFQGCMMRGA